MEVSGKLVEDKNIKSLSQMFQLCEHCQFENKTTQASGICRECEEYMCDVCFQHHLKGRRNRTHELLDVNEPDIASTKRAREVAKCHLHDNETIKFYCRKHELVGCGDCIILEHSVCKPEYIKDLSKGVQETEDFVNLIRKLEQLDRDNKAAFEKIENNRRDCKRNQEEVLKEIRKCRTHINMYLDLAEATLISEVEKLESDNENFLDQLENDCKVLTSKIESLKEKLDTRIHRDNELFIQSVRNKTNIENVEQEISKHVQGFGKVKHYDFVPEKQLYSLVKSTKNLGCLKFSNTNTSESEGTLVEAMGIDRKPCLQTGVVELNTEYEEKGLFDLLNRIESSDCKDGDMKQSSVEVNDGFQGKENHLILGEIQEEDRSKPQSSVSGSADRLQQSGSYKIIPTSGAGQIQGHGDRKMNQGGIPQQMPLNGPAYGQGQLPSGYGHFPMRGLQPNFTSGQQNDPFIPGHPSLFEPKIGHYPAFSFPRLQGPQGGEYQRQQSTGPFAGNRDHFHVKLQGFSTEVKSPHERTISDVKQPSVVVGSRVKHSGGESFAHQ